MKILQSLLSQAGLLLIAAFICACEGAQHESKNDGGAAANPERILVVASNYPLYFFASRIVEDVENAPEIVFPEIDGDPTLWIPNVDQVRLLQSADIVLLNGAGAEPWQDLISIDKSLLFDTSKMMSEKLIPLEGDIAHQHGPEGEHSDRGTAFTTWLDPQLAIEQSQAITNALADLSPASEAQFRNNMAKLEVELLGLDSEVAAVFENLDGRPVLFSHPVYQYLQRRYGIAGRSVHWEPDEEPTTTAWIELQQLLVEHPATIMVWENVPLTSTAQRLSDSGIESVRFLTVANRPDEGDYISVMRENVRQLEREAQ